MKTENWRRWARAAGLQRQKEFARGLQHARLMADKPELRAALYGQSHAKEETTTGSRETAHRKEE
jgi:hypothetical protein